MTSFVSSASASTPHAADAEWGVDLRAEAQREAGRLIFVLAQSAGGRFFASAAAGRRGRMGWRGTHGAELPVGTEADAERDDATRSTNPAGTLSINRDGLLTDTEIRRRAARSARPRPRPGHSDVTQPALFLKLFLVVA